MNEEIHKGENTVTYFINSISSSNFPDMDISSLKHSSYRIKNNLRNQQKRLKNNNIQFVSNTRIDGPAYGSILDFINSLNRNENQTFCNQLYLRNGSKDIQYYKNGKLIGRIEEGIEACTNITFVKNQDRINTKNIECPSCGNIIELKNIDQGCNYCNSKFTFNDLYPVVTNYYEIPSVSSERVKSKADKIQKSLNSYIIFALIVSLSISIFAPYDKIGTYTGEIFSSQNIFVFLCNLFYYLIFFGMLFPFYYIFRALLLSFSIMFKFAGTGIKNTSNQLYNSSSKCKLEKFIQPYDNGFTYYLFQGKVIELLKEIIYSDNPNNLNYCNCKVNYSFSNVIDCIFNGSMRVSNINIVNDIINIDLILGVKTTELINNKIKRFNRTVYITVSRNKSVHTESEFKVSSMSCKNCGGTVNLNNGGVCPYCDTHYNLMDYEFVITNFKLR